MAPTHARVTKKQRLDTNIKQGTEKKRSQAPLVNHKPRLGTASTKADLQATKTLAKDKSNRLRSGKNVDESSSPVKNKPPSSFKIIAGSYEKLLYGLEGTFNSTDGEPSTSIPTLKPIFIFPAHVASVRSVSASPLGGKWLATGSSDEIIKVWDLRRRKEIGGLMQHQGSITYLGFPSQSHLISASDDGTICLFRARDWALLRSFKGHKGRVNCVAVHPSGKLALSVGQDRTIRMWDFMRGKASASTKVGKECELVRWSPSGNIFAVQTMSTIDIYSTNMEVVASIKHRSRIQDIKFVANPVNGNDLLLVSSEDKKVAAYALNEGGSEGTTDDYNIVAEFAGNTSRVKAMDTLKICLPSNESTEYLTTVSSDGKILLFDLGALKDISSSGAKALEINPLVSYDTKGSRLTCVCMADGEAATIPPIAGLKRTLAQEAESELDGSLDGSVEDTDESDEE